VQLVEGHRVDGKVRQRVVATLGRLDELKASGQLDRWAGALARLDPPVGTRREVGALLLVTHYLRRLGLVELVDSAAPMRGKSLLTHGEVIAALVANRLSAPAPLYDVAGWAGQAAIAELLNVPASLLNDDRLGRALEAFWPVAEDLRGRLLLTTLDTFEVDASRLHLDLTTIRFAGAYPDSTLVKKGWGPDRRVARQGPHPASLHPRRRRTVLAAPQGIRSRTDLRGSGPGEAGDPDTTLLVRHTRSSRHNSRPQHAPRCVGDARKTPGLPSRRRLAMHALGARLILRTSGEGH